ncbi:cysteine proteinase [Thozetella sp. PMI_491]|nr:cysteine proteinase [Thozetella sp. PMI_491]
MEARAQEHERQIGLVVGQEALDHAIAAADLYYRAAERATTPSEKSRLSRKCNEVIALAERLKANARAAAAASRPPVPESTRQLSTAEKTVVLKSSKLHGKVFRPWDTPPDPTAFSISSGGDGGPVFVDDTIFSLSEEQKEIFAGWKRPVDISSLMGSLGSNGPDNLMVANGECDLAQDLATDCSVVASLAAAMRHLGPQKSSLLPGLMYPFDTDAMRPAVSKNGKYIFRMYFNGCWRQVVIDDRLPSSSTGRTIYVVDKRNPQLVWPALIEKAYLKIRGGYDFPGSNSATDLYALTGWIPEQIFLQTDDIEPDDTWRRISEAYHQGNALVTLGTGNILPEEQKTLGLVKEHDYAVVDLKTDPNTGSRLFLVKNPWCDSLVWTGAGSATTIRTHTPGASTTSGGGDMSNTFWIGFDDVMQHFESLYVSWNPALFRHRQDHHFAWDVPDKTVQPALTHNPQYSIKSPAAGPIWILFSRHWQDGELDILRSWKARQSAGSPIGGARGSDGALATVSRELGFMSLAIFQTSPQGTRVPVQEGHNVLHLGPYVDSPNTLLRFDNPVPNRAYTLVVLQSGLPLPKYSFTISLFSNAPLTVSPASELHPRHATTTGSWTRRTAGGSAAYASYFRNPQFALTVPTATPLSLLLSTDDRALPVHVALLFSRGGQRVTAVAGRDVLARSAEYQRGCTIASAPNVAAGTYTVVCSTYEPGQLGDFTLRVSADAAVSLRPVLADAAGRLRMEAEPLAFRDGEERFRARVGTGRLTRVSAVARSDPAAGAAPCAIRVGFEFGSGPHRATLAVSGDGEFHPATLGLRTDEVDVDPETARTRGGLWLVVDRIGSQRSSQMVQVEILSDGPVQIGAWENADET